MTIAREPLRSCIGACSQIRINISCFSYDDDEYFDALSRGSKWNAKADYSEILPNLFLGNEQAAMACSFNLAVNATRNVESHGYCTDRLSVPHQEEWDLFMPLLEKVRALLNDGRSVLVHCRSGRHRAAALTAAFVAHLLQISAHDAMLHVRAARRQVDLRDKALQAFVHWAVSQ